MGFSEELRKKAAPIWDKEHQHPFVTGIGDGTLPLEKFRYYMRQDYVFLIEFCRAISLAVVKAPAVEDMGWFARLLHETLNTEMALHVGFCEDFGITEDELKRTQPSPTTLAYTRHLVQSGFSGGVVEVAAAILPCSWGYCEIGQMLADRGAPANQPLYARWIEMYSSPQFAELAGWLRSFIDRAALSSGRRELERMERAFLISSQYEYMFWDAAYRMEEWPI
jgi:thiaminase/transcriptional activator TenA